VELKDSELKTGRRGAILNESAQGRTSKKRRSRLVDSSVGWGSQNHESDTNTRRGTPDTAGKADGEADSKTSGGKGRRETSDQNGRATRAGSLQAVQAGLGGHRGTHTERAGYALRLSVLSEVASCTRSGARV
jgi:hypothetical protein